MRRSAKLVVLAATAVALGAASARAEHPQIKLSYASEKSPPSCPDEATFRGLVAARLGYDPFVSADVRALAVGYRQRGSEVVGHLELSAEGDAKPLNRSLRAAADECFELASSMALVVAVAVDPDALSGSQPAQAAPSAPVAAPPTNQKAESAAAPEPVRPAPRTLEKAERSRTALRLSLGGLQSIGVVPAVTLGARVGAALDLGAWSVALEGAFLSAGTRKHEEGRGEVRGSAFIGSLVPCLEPAGSDRWGIELCAVGSVGTLLATAREVLRAAPTHTVVASLGPRVAASLMFSRVFGVGLSADVPVALSRTHLFIEEGGEKTEVWAQPAVGGIFSAAIVAAIW